MRITQLHVFNFDSDIIIICLILDSYYVVNVNVVRAIATNYRNIAVLHRNSRSVLYHTEKISRQEIRPRHCCHGFD
jgi:hypothetical protein